MGESNMWEIIIQECKAWKKRHASLAILFGVPFVFALLFGFLYSANVIKNIPLVIYDQDQSQVSRALIQAFSDSERYQIVGQVNSQEELDEYIRNKKAVAALTIPYHLSRDIKQSKAVNLSIEVNSPNIMYANSVLSTYPEITGLASVGVAVKQMEGLNQPPAQAVRSAAPVRINVRITDNPTASYTNFVLPGFTINGWMIAMYLVTSTLLTAEYFDLARRNLPTWAIITSKLLPCWLLSVVSFILSFTLLVAYFHIPLRGSVLHLLSVAGAFAFAVNAFGLFVSSITPNIILVIVNFAVYIMSAFLCCGYSWPVIAFNDFANIYSAILPITYCAVTIREIMLSAASPNMVKNILVLVAFGIGCCLAAKSILSLRYKKINANAQSEEGFTCNGG
jgi:ABC-2 type transport system permease protein